MKTAFPLPFFLAAVLLGTGALVPSLHAGDLPAYTIQQVMAAAQQSLVDKGAANDVYITSIALKRTSLTAKNAVWEVAWSAPITGSKPGSQEVGLQINMNGDVVHLLKGRGEFRVPLPH